MAKTGETTFIVTSKNNNEAEGQLSCAESATPLRAWITFATGTVINSVSTYCPDYRYQDIIPMPPQAVLKIYAVFANSQGLGQSFTFDYVGPDGLGGALSSFALSR